MSIENWINSAYATEIADRARMVSIHQTDADTMYMGEDDETGFTVLSCADADEVVSNIQTAAGSTSNYVVEVNYNGLSTASSFSITGVPVASLTADGGAPGGYARPSGRIIVRPGFGYSPEFACSGNVLSFTGINRINFKGITWKCGFYFGDNPSFFPLPSVTAFTDNNVIDGDGFNAFGIQMIYAWTTHIEDTAFLSNWSCISGSAVNYRAWNNSSLYGRNNDIQGFRGYESWMSGYMSNIWSAGWRVFHTDANQPSEGLHPDFLQIMTFDDQHQGYNLIVEFNIGHLDGKRNPDGYHAQGLFGNDSKTGGGTLDHTVNGCVHNNILAIGASWALFIPDPEDNGIKLIHRNLVTRCAYGFEHEQFDPYGFVVAFKGSDKPDGTGSARITENYMYIKTWAQDDPVSSGTIRSNNIHIDPTANAGVGDRPQDHFKGTDGLGGGWTAQQTYTRPEQGTSTVSAATAAFLAFVEPQVGWRGASVGPMAPSTWPTDYLSLQAGQPPSLPVMGRNITINLTAGA